MSKSSSLHEIRWCGNSQGSSAFGFSSYLFTTNNASVGSDTYICVSTNIYTRHLNRCSKASCSRAADVPQSQIPHQGGTAWSISSICPVPLTFLQPPAPHHVCGWGLAHATPYSHAGHWQATTTRRYTHCVINNLERPAMTERLEYLSLNVARAVSEGFVSLPPFSSPKRAC